MLLTFHRLSFQCAGSVYAERYDCSDSQAEAPVAQRKPSLWSLFL